MKRKKGKKGGNSIWRIVVIVLVGLAVRDQLRLPPEERTWHGKIADRIPYDFRLPTKERILAAYWNKDTSQLLVPQPFGIGWTVNLYPLLHPGTAPNQQ